MSAEAITWIKPREAWFTNRAFARDCITLQSIRAGLAPFAAALIGYVEATREDTAAKNRLCPPHAQPDTPRDWVRGMLASMRADYLWPKEPDLGERSDRSRLNPRRGLSQHDAGPRVQQARRRFLEHVGPGLARLEQLLAQAPA